MTTSWVKLKLFLILKNLRSLKLLFPDLSRGYVIPNKYEELGAKGSAWSFPIQRPTVTGLLPTNLSWACFPLYRAAIMYYEDWHARFLFFQLPLYHPNIHTKYF